MNTLNKDVLADSSLININWDRLFFDHKQNASAAPENEVARKAKREKIKERFRQENAVLVAHYYTDAEIQSLAEETGGFVSDSLEMARFGKTHSASTVVVAGVKFMGETAKILTPQKRVLMPTLEATCSLDLGCKYEDFSAFCDQYPDRTVVVYANTSALVKARADWVVTSSIALKVVDHLDSLGEKIIWAPDKYLGGYIKNRTKADMLLWNAACIVHEEFKAKALLDLKHVYPEAGVLVHPESPESVIALADAVGSTSQLIQAARALPHPLFIVATDRGIFYKMQQAAPLKRFIEAPTGGQGASCRSCAHCPWMAMNNLDLLLSVFDRSETEIFVPEDVAIKAIKPLNRMLSFVAG